MKSREVFDPSKPFVFPPIRKSSGNASGCGCLVIGAIVAVVIIGALGNHNQPSTTPSPPVAPPSTPAPIPPSPPPPKASTDQPPASSSPVITSVEAPRPSGPSVSLKDVSTFPVTIIMTQRIEIKTSSGGFGLDPGDELLVVRKKDGNYTISHQNQESEVSASLLDSMQTK